MRYQHIFNTIDTTENEVRVYIEGQDFYESDAPHPLPYLHRWEKEEYG